MFTKALRLQQALREVDARRVSASGREAVEGLLVFERSPSVAKPVMWNHLPNTSTKMTTQEPSQQAIALKVALRWNGSVSEPA